MDFQKDLEYYQIICEQKSPAELRILRKVLIKTLQSLDERLESAVKNTGSKTRCPHCRSNNTKGHGRAPTKRFYCLDCDRTFSEAKNCLYYSKQNHNKILNLIITIHITNKSISQITHDLNISMKTYYKWKKDIIAVFPQLEEKFKRKRVKK